MISFGGRLIVSELGSFFLLSVADLGATFSLHPMDKTQPAGTLFSLISLLQSPPSV
jgi:hypothetical protein